MVGHESLQKTVFSVDGSREAAKEKQGINRAERLRKQTKEEENGSLTVTNR